MIRIFLFLILFSFPSFFLSAETSSTASEPPKEGYYIVTYKNYGVNLELTANGYQIREGDANTDSSGQADINYWILPGKNTLRIRLTERKQKKPAEPSLTPEAEVNLVIGQKGQFPDEGTPILSFKWPSNPGEIPNGEWTELEFTPAFIPPSELWNMAETIELTKEKEKSALTFAKEFTKVLNSKDPKKIFPYIEFRAKETSEVRYYPYDAKDELKSLTGFTKAMGSTWKLDDKNPKFELLADKKILNLTNKKGEPPISSKKGASIPMFISWIKGKWVIVR